MSVTRTRKRADRRAKADKDSVRNSQSILNCESCQHDYNSQEVNIVDGAQFICDKCL
jgi:predicted SprT family Zn-dependent metalloprotease